MVKKRVLKSIVFQKVTPAKMSENVELCFLKSRE